MDPPNKRRRLAPKPNDPLPSPAATVATAPSPPAQPAVPAAPVAPVAAMPHQAKYSTEQVRYLLGLVQPALCPAHWLTYKPSRRVNTTPCKSHHHPSATTSSPLPDTCRMQQSIFTTRCRGAHATRVPLCCCCDGRRMPLWSTSLSLSKRCSARDTTTT